MGSAVVRRARLRSAPRDVARELRSRRWAVLAPHPDDETLGAGALLCALADLARPARVVYLTDGAASHPGAPGWPPARLAARRRREARAALRRLTRSARPEPVFLDWPDGAPYPQGSPAFAASARRLAALLRRDRTTALVATWIHEPHGDHAAAARLARAAAARRLGRVALYDYVVWGWRAPQAAGLARRRALPLPRTAAAAVARRAALAQHRSQLGAVIPDCPDGFRLPAAMLRVEDQALFGSGRLRASDLH